MSSERPHDPAGEPADPAEAIAAALGRIRGPRGPRGMRGPEREGGADPHHAHGGMHGHGPRGPFGHGGLPPGPPWMMPGGRGGPARMRLLDALAAASTPLSVSEIGEAIGVDQPRASRLVQQAVEFELVRREADPDDARRTRIALTPRGSALAHGFRGERREAIRTALSSFSDAEQQDLARLLAKLADAWPR
ncbi:MarR family winged helix-turn-helix transcriptional regulator [Microbacterium sp. NPDC089189]|uniref:MarR family winged helix-turn-helix transcriptional regulator n=1 Tax=Microbacterium sp. NPDC089189 TaxID=3154972 RepID=UPI00343F0EBE